MHQVRASLEIGSDRPSTLPLSESVSLDDATMRVSHGFKVRPLRDGGFPRSSSAALENRSSRFRPTASGAKQHPFPDSVLKEIRDFILPQHSQPDAGQPFFLDVIHKLLKDIQDVDSGYPVTLREGVPLGVDTPTLKSPGVWPLKSELIGEVGPN